MKTSDKLVFTGLVLLILLVFRLALSRSLADATFWTNLQIFLMMLSVALPGCIVYVWQNARPIGLLMAIIVMYIVSGIYLVIVPPPIEMDFGRFAATFLQRPVIPLVAFLLSIVILRPYRRRHDSVN